ncbi:protein gp37 [Flavobacterium nitrogenifigens]|uniref:Protein gp37 n=2 Tax=Flavobacterium TaxID=237 RepID=A0A7W7J1A4_9FLAO|nr:MULTISPECIES: DUF5131 family protein [Flavobacterium]MBB4804384.1 protein gp37 [Flavobacterium nitrogenifigens]MBB6389220.1 protein gp37 [Flavobacterium notoginsengisoli]
MGSKIEWTSKTWNPTTGCTHYSSSKNGGNECLNCYAETETKRLQLMDNKKYNQGFDVVVEHHDELKKPYEWKKPTTVFVNSMSDLFHKDVSDTFIEKVFEVMNDNKQHIFQILTKRHDRIQKLPKNLNWSDNIWLGVSCGTQYATKRIPALVSSPAKYKFLSIEPLVQEITEIELDGIDWVIVGGESGNTSYKIEKDSNGQEKYQISDGKKKFIHQLDKAGNKIIKNKIRPLKKEWVETIRDKCIKKDVPFFFKQWGKTKNNPNPNDPSIHNKHRYHAKGGCELDGKIYWSNPTISDHSIPKINLFGTDYLIMDEINDLVTIWEIKTHLPSAEPNLLNSIKESIHKNGLHNPILYVKMQDGKKLVIDGHTRLDALLELKIKDIPTKQVDETFNSLEEIKLWIVKNQLGRRNLSITERVKLALLSKPTIEKLAKENLSKAGKISTKKSSENSLEIKPIDTNAEIARIANVSKNTVVNYSTVMRKGSEALKKDLSEGTISIGAAYNSLKNKPEITNEIRPQSLAQKVNKINEAHDIKTFGNLTEEKCKIFENEDAREANIITILNLEERQDKIFNNGKINDYSNIPVLINLEEEKHKIFENEEIGESNIITLSNLEEGKSKILKNELDIIILSKPDKIDILKKISNVKIGIYYIN